MEFSVLFGINTISSAVDKKEGTNLNNLLGFTYHQKKLISDFKIS